MKQDRVSMQNSAVKLLTWSIIFLGREFTHLGVDAGAQQVVFVDRQLVRGDAELLLLVPRRYHPPQRPVGHIRARLQRQVGHWRARRALQPGVQRRALVVVLVLRQHGVGVHFLRNGARKLLQRVRHADWQPAGAWIIWMSFELVKCVNIFFFFFIFFPNTALW